MRGWWGQACVVPRGVNVSTIIISPVVVVLAQDRLSLIAVVGGSRWRYNQRIVFRRLFFPAGWLLAGCGAPYPAYGADANASVNSHPTYIRIRLNRQSDTRWRSEDGFRHPFANAVLLQRLGPFHAVCWPRITRHH